MRLFEVCRSDQHIEMEESLSQSTPLSAFIDRIEGELAVIVLSDGSGVQFELPRKYLPPEARGGDHLLINLEPHPTGRQAALQTVTELQRELTAGNDAEQINFKL
jgi:hypothetical protein